MRKAAGSWLALGFLFAVVFAVRAGERRRPRRPTAPRPVRAPVSAGAAAAGDDLEDDALEARVRERVRIPADVEVVVQDGAVVLFGRIERGLVAGLLERVAAVEGVGTIQDRLTPVDLVAPERPPGPPDPTP